MSRWSCLFVGLFGCGFGVSPVEVRPPPQDLDVSDIIPGDRATFSVQGLNANATALFFVSQRGFGTGPCAPAGSPCLDIDRPILVGQAASVGGLAELRVRVPATFPAGTPLWMQAVVLSGGLAEKTDVERRSVGVPDCPPDLERDCQGNCRPESLFGDGTCNAFLDCPETQLDLGDCIAPPPTCPAGLTEDCAGLCRNATLLGDGTCNAFLACEETDWDDGDCDPPDTAITCPPGLTLDCMGLCRDETLLGDGSCNAFFACEETSWDNGDCQPPMTGCPAGLTEDCTGLCRDETLLGDGTCNTFLACEETAWDNGDCEPPDTGMGACPAGLREDCTGLCRPEILFGNGTCNPFLDCAATNQDDGDCP